MVGGGGGGGVIMVTTLFVIGFMSCSKALHSLVVAVAEMQLYEDGQGYIAQDRSLSGLGAGSSLL